LGAQQLEYMGTAKANSVVPLPSHLLRVLVRPEGLKKLADSKLVEFWIDRTEFTLTQENLVALRALAKRME
jgi:hypothetical protein